MMLAHCGSRDEGSSAGDPTRDAAEGGGRMIFTPADPATQANVMLWHLTSAFTGPVSQTLS
jgi:hypothetical protein